MNNETIIKLPKQVEEITSQLETNVQEINELKLISDSTVGNSKTDLIKKMISNANNGSITMTYIMVGDSTRASNGAWVYNIVSQMLKNNNVNTYLSAQSGLKAEHWSTFTPNLQPNYITVNDILPLIPNNGDNTVVDICLGINDAFTKSSEDTIKYIKYGIDIIKTSKPNVVFNITSPNRLSDQSVVKKLQDVYSNISTTYDCSFINVLDNVFKTWTSKIQADYFVDNTHPSELGQRRMADYILDKITPNSTNNKANIFTTGVIAPNKFKKIATININKQYYGIYGTFLFNSSPGNELKCSSATLDVAITQSSSLGTDCSKLLEVTINNNGGGVLDFYKNSFIARTRVCDSSKTIIDIYIKNTNAGNRVYDFTFLGNVNTTGSEITYSILSNSQELISMDIQANGTTDMNATFTSTKYLGSADGSLWAIKIDNTGVITTSKKA